MMPVMFYAFSVILCSFAIPRTVHQCYRGYLAASKIPMSLNDAKARGYTRCKVCRPPQLSQQYKKC